MEESDYEGSVEKVKKEQQALSAINGTDPEEQKKSVDFFLENMENLEPGTISALLEYCQTASGASPELMEKIRLLCS